MKLTDSLKSKIDSMDYEEMLAKWRFASIGDPLFTGESGDYFGKRMAELRASDPDRHTRVSKQIGW